MVNGEFGEFGRGQARGVYFKSPGAAGTTRALLPVQLGTLVAQSGTTLTEIPGVASIVAAKVIGHTGKIARFPDHTTSPASTAQAHPCDSRKVIAAESLFALRFAGMATGSSLSAVPAVGDDDLRYAEELLARDGIIPVADRVGHRGALQLWRNHGRAADPDYSAMLAEVQRLLARPRCALDRADRGYTQTSNLAWVRSSDILITAPPGFPDQGGIGDLAQLAWDLLAGHAVPDATELMLGDSYGLTTVDAPHGPLHQIRSEDHHRLLAIRAAGFPVVLAVSRRYQGPWPLPHGGSRRTTRLAYLRLLFRAGFLADHRRSDDEDIATAERWGQLLLADSVRGVLGNVAAYEGFYGVCAAWPDWLRDPEQMINLLKRELRTMNVDPIDFPGIVGRWPPPETGMLGAIIQRIVGPKADLDDASE